jgi:hypothetical protein
MNVNRLDADQHPPQKRPNPSLAAWTIAPNALGTELHAMVSDAEFARRPRLRTPSTATLISICALPEDDSAVAVVKETSRSARPGPCSRLETSSTSDR